MLQSRPTLRHYIAAIALTLIALALTLALRPILSPDFHGLFWVAALISTLYGGVRCGLVTLITAVIAADYFLEPPINSLQFSGANIIRLALLIVLAAIIASLEHRLRRYEEKQRFLSRAGEALGSSLDYARTLTEIAHFAVPTIADWCILDLIDDAGEIRRLSVVHRNPAWQDLALQLQERYPVLKFSDDHTLIKVLRSGQARVRQLSDEELRAGARDFEHYQLLHDLGYKSEIVIQLKVRERLLGALTLVYGESGRRYSEQDVPVAEEVARRAALAIDNARLFRETQSQRERLRVILTSITDGVVAIGLDGCVTFLNPVAERLTGWNEADAIGQPVETVLRLADSVDDALDGRVLYAADGQPVPIDYADAPIRYPDGEADGRVIVFQDARERHRIEAERADILRREQTARKAAEDANELKLRFLAMISHELRTPLASIKGFSSTLLAPDMTWDLNSYHEFVGIMDREADKLTELVEQLLDVSRLQAGTLKINPVSCRLPDILNLAMPGLKTVSQAHDFQIRFPDDLPPVAADDRRIAQVIVNLVENAAKYSPLKTVITLSARAVGGQVQVAVSDQGYGIPPEERERVFEAFRQVERPGSERGAGLGLAICKGLVEAHGGRIWIEAEETQGTIVRFTLPIASRPA